MTAARTAPAAASGWRAQVEVGCAVRTRLLWPDGKEPFWWSPAQAGLTLVVGDPSSGATGLAEGLALAAGGPDGAGAVLCEAVAGNEQGVASRVGDALGTRGAAVVWSADADAARHVALLCQVVPGAVFGMRLRGRENAWHAGQELQVPVAKILALPAGQAWARSGRQPARLVVPFPSLLRGVGPFVPSPRVAG